LSSEPISVQIIVAPVPPASLLALVYGFLLHLRIQFCDFGVAPYKFKSFAPRKCVMAATTSVNSFDQFTIFRRIQSPAMVPQIFIGSERHDLESFGMFVLVRRHLNTLMTLWRFAPCRGQRLSRHYLHVKAAGIRDDQRIGRVIGFLIEKGADRGID